MNAVVRTIIHMLYGQALMAGSYKEAANCYQRAVALRPDYLIHRVELGRTYVKLGQPQEAAKELETALELDVPDINALLQKVRAGAAGSRGRGMEERGKGWQQSVSWGVGGRMVGGEGWFARGA